MNATIFRQTTSDDFPPPFISVHLQALWYDAKGNWQKAHEIIEHLEDKNAAWVHAYLHRKEGDNPNAAYWYRKANKAMPVTDLAAEWDHIVLTFL